MKSRRHLHVAIVGAGKVGSVLGRILVEGGGKVVAVVSRSGASARRAGRFVGCRNTSTDLASIPRNVDIVFITAPHAAVETIAQSVARLPGLDYRKLAVCHASGMLTAAALEPLAERGALVFSFHPLQTFPRDFPPGKILETARGIYFGVDGTPRALRIARLFARALGGYIIEIPPDRREFYHAACVLASNHLATMMWILETMYGAVRPGSRDFFRVFKPIVMATLANIEQTSPSRALSGPIARGGVETVAAHFEALQELTPKLIPYFAALSRETVRCAVWKGSINASQEQALLELISSHEKVDQTNKEIH
jgi:predicted short-subunit dehydrogenase-like oxidoreductase (DUF2520 family)